MASYISTFLKPEMLHVYRQVNGLQRFRSLVVARKLENSHYFPHTFLRTVPANPLRFFRKWNQRRKGFPLMIGAFEVRHLTQILEQERAALLHVYQGHYAVELLPFLRQTQLPWVVSFHGADATAAPDHPAYRSALQEVFAHCQLAMVRSQSLWNRLLDLGCPLQKIRLQRTGIPLADFPFTDRSQPADGAWNIVQAGRFVPKKGYPRTLQAFVVFKAQWPKARLQLAGEGPLHAELLNQADRLGLKDSIDFVGHLDPSGLAGLLDQAHLFVHPSETPPDGNSEGVPNSLLEAMATGLPVVATRHGGIEEAVSDGENGFLVPEKDPKALAEAMLRITNDYPAALQMGRRASTTVAEEFELTNRIQALETLYTEAVSP